MASENRSAHPDIPGVPWWGAILIAATATVAGFAIDAAMGHKELTTPFAALYMTGCLAAVLAVRQSGVFTAVVQPPLILFVAVPTAYFLFHRSEIHGLKDILINCGYPLIERFLLMFTTSVLVLLIGMARWYFGGRQPAGKPATAKVAAAGALGGVGAKIAALLGQRAAGDEPAAEPQPARRPRKHGIDRPAASAKPPRPRRAASPDAPTRSRHARPPMDDPDGPPTPRRRYASHTRDDAAADAPPPPRRRRPPPPREPNTRTSTREYRARDWEPPAPSDRARRYSRNDSGYDGRDGYEPYRPYEPYEPPPRRPTPPSSHHPISNVRYRGDSENDGEDRYRRPRPRD